jgi:hypothetical protein
MDLVQLAERFQSEEKCRQYLADLRWPNGLRCLKCGGSHVYKVQTRSRYECAEKSCRHQFSVTAETIFHDSHLPLWKWMLTAYLMCESKKSMSANQIKRTIKVSYKTAWYLCHRIRAAMKDASAEPLRGTVEVDETYVGGKVRGKGRGYRGNKAMVLAAIQRGGGVRFAVEKHADRPTLHGFIHRTTAPDTARIMTDEWAAYAGIADDNTTHETVKHSADEWVRGDVHTNSVEGVFSLFKRGIIGAYHRISVKHMPAYLDETAHRFNNRHNAFMFRDTMLKLIEAKAVSFKALTAAGQG